MGESLGRWHGECPWVVREQEDRLKTSHVCCGALWRASGGSQFQLGYGNTGGPEIRSQYSQYLFTTAFVLEAGFSYGKQ